MGRLIRSSPIWANHATPLVSAAVIAVVPDHAALGRLLDALWSVRGVADECVVVLDTASYPEASGALAAEGCQVFFREWTNDYAAARNAAASHCRGDWALVIDGDELLADPADLRELIEGATLDVDGIRVWTTCIGDAGPSEAGPQVRAYRRRRGRWVFPRHNSLEGLRVIRDSRARLSAFYVGTAQEKAKRAIPHLLELAAADPDEPRWPYFLGHTYRVLPDHECAKQWALVCLTMTDAPRYARAWVDLFYSTLAIDGLPAAEDILVAARALHAGMADLWHCYLTMNAMRYFMACGDPGPYADIGQESIIYVDGLPAAAKELGLPMTFSEDEPEPS